MLVRDWMIRDVVTVTTDTSIVGARRLMDSYQIRHLPVVQGDCVVGMVSDRNLRAAEPVDGDRRTAHAAAPSVASLMSAPAKTIAPTESIARASGMMIAERIGALPVVRDGRLVGICSLVDCLRAYLAAERKRARTGSRRPAAEDDPDLWLRISMPPGDPRPGRRARPVAVEARADNHSHVVSVDAPARKAG